MKVTRESEAFKPVIITLETQEEIDILTSLTGMVIGSTSNASKAFTESLFCKLSPCARPYKERSSYFDG